MTRKPLLLPLYLSVDIPGHRSPSGEPAVNDAVRALLQGLRADPGLARRIRITIVGVREGKQTRFVRAMQLDAMDRWTDVEHSGTGSYATVLSSIDDWIAEDYAYFDAQSEPAAPPLVLVFTGWNPAENNDFEPELRALSKHWAGINVRPIRLFGDHQWADILRHPVAAKAEGAENAADPAAVVEIVRQHAQAQMNQDPRPPAEADGIEAPVCKPSPGLSGVEWVGAFTEYAVGHPGAAARGVRPRPDTREWDRRDTVLDGVDLAADDTQWALRLRAASSRGRSHRHTGKVRQDEYGFRCTDDLRYLVMVVSDGLSSGPESHHAAALVCRTGTSLIADALRDTPPDKLDWTAIVGTLSAQIRDLCGRWLGREVDAREAAGLMAATAVFAVLELRATDDRRIVNAYAVGDSAAWVLHGGTAWESLFPVKNADVGDAPATSATKALPVATMPAGDPISMTLRRSDVLVLMSDGIGDPLQDGVGPVGRFLAEAWQTAPEPLDFAAQVDFARKSHDDDRTAVAVWDLAK